MQKNWNKEEAMPNLIPKEPVPENPKDTTPKYTGWQAPERPFLASTAAKRGRAALEAQAFLRGTIRARLRRIYPELSAREITFKYFEEIAKNG